LLKGKEFKMYKRNKFADFIYIICLLLLAFSIGYLIQSYNYLSGEYISQSTFNYQTFRSLDNDDYVYFGDYSNSILVVDDNVYSLEFLTYQENYFLYISDIDDEEVSINFVAIDVSTIYNDYFNIYFYGQSTD